MFGNIFRRKFRLIRRLEGINRTLFQGDNDRLLGLRNQLWHEYCFLIQQEELYWLHQARAKNITEGDLNTRFFHQRSLNRRRRNRIVALQDANDEWIYDEEQLQQLVINFYSALYSSSGEIRGTFLTRSSFPTIKEHDLIILASAVSFEETKHALFGMQNLKALGPDGYHPLFFKSQWHIIGESLFNFVASCFHHPQLIRDVNKTLLTLIPKCEDPTKVSHFRPIALCNVAYKVVTKVITQRLRVIMPYVVSDNQSSFIPGRSTVDNILVLQETIHSLKSLQGKKGYMILKLDLEKAYDRMEWGFVMETLSCLGFPSDLQSLISHCISTASLHVNWNGSMTNMLNFSRGLRQGDPISPYLFVLCLERLGHMISDAVSSGAWLPFKFGRGNGPTFSHMCFADDLILVAEASPSQVDCIKEVLHSFCTCSGQKINFAKSLVYFSDNMDSSQVVTLSDALGVNVTKDLGAPILHQRMAKQSFSFILDKMRKKLAGWKAKSLSFAGKVTLAQASLLNILGYVFQTSLIPASMCEEAEKLCRDFI